MNVWPQRGWRASNGMPVANIDIWKRLKREVASCPPRVEAHWAKGHKLNIYNGAADKLAKKSAC